MLTSPMHAADVALALAPAAAASTGARSSLLTVQNSVGVVSVVRVDRQTGKLIRSTVGSTSGASVPVQAAPPHIQQMVDRSARNHGIDPLLVQSVIQVESGYNPYAISSKGAEGLMQLMPGTSRTLRVGNTFDPAENIEAGVRYLKALQDQYKDDRLALAAYNAGPKAVDKFKQIPPYAETVNYVEQVGSRYRAARAKLDRNTTPLAAQLAAQEAPEYNQHKQIEQHPKLEQFIDDQGRLYLKTAAD